MHIYGRTAGLFAGYCAAESESPCAPIPARVVRRAEPFVFVKSRSDRRSGLLVRPPKRTLASPRSRLKSRAFPGLFALLFSSLIVLQQYVSSYKRFFFYYSLPLSVGFCSTFHSLIFRSCGILRRPRKVSPVIPRPFIFYFAWIVSVFFFSSLVSTLFYWYFARIPE